MSFGFGGVVVASGTVVTGSTADVVGPSTNSSPTVLGVAGSDDSAAGDDVPEVEGDSVKRASASDTRNAKIADATRADTGTTAASTDG